MQAFKVGGYCRNAFIRAFHPDIHIQSSDIDWVVLNSSPEEMLAKGFISVGKQFPVFLHPITREEYALARKEKCVGKGHKDFEFIFDKFVTLEEDLERRDFTMNALVELADRKIYDPFGGIEDIKHKQIRHIKAGSFREDPLRVLRGCRFAAQLGFNIFPATLDLFKEMVNDGAIQNLTAERIWKELKKVLESPYPEKFFKYMEKIGALKVVLPELHQLVSCKENLEQHPEGNSFKHTMLCLNRVAGRPFLVFAMLFHDIGKIKTPKEEQPKYYNHDILGVPLIQDICARLAIPNSYRDFAILICENHMKRIQLNNMRATNYVRLISKISKGFKDLDQLEKFIDCCFADILGRKNPKIESLLEFSQEVNRLRGTYHLCCKEAFSNIPNWERFKPKDRTNAWFEYLGSKWKNEFLRRM